MVAGLFPFTRWFEHYSKATFRADFISGLTVALVLIPQSMAYAQLAGLPSYYGLYAAFLPPIVAAMFGSSHQLATGPVAVVSLMTATALEPLATSGSEAYIAYAILLALSVGVFQFLLGILRLGLVVNFLSHPVVNGFTNAAALIIATSQLSKLFGVDVDKAVHHYETVINVIKAALESTHLPTLLLAALAFAIMYGLKKLNPRIPNVLVAVGVTTVISWAVGFEHNYVADISSIHSENTRQAIRTLNTSLTQLDSIVQHKVEIKNLRNKAVKKNGDHSEEIINLRYKISICNLKIAELKEKASAIRTQLRACRFRAVDPATAGGTTTLDFYSTGELPSGLKDDGRRWRLKIGHGQVDETGITLIGGGAVVGNIPSGLPSIAIPKIDLGILTDLISMVIIISILGFMEAISIAKAMAARTGQRLDPNQELIGQGLANIVGSFGQSYACSGSFSRSAVNLGAGALTGMSSVFSSMIVVITLLFLTPLLYHLPQSVLAAVIMMAVIGLLNVKGFIHAWQAQKYDGVIAITSFVFTIAFAPHLDKGLMIGVLLSLGHYLFRNIRPDIALLSKFSDGTFRSIKHWGLKQCKHIGVIRFNSALIFANVSFLEEQILELEASMPELKHILIVCNGINEIDASGEDMLSLIVGRMREAGYDVSLTGLNDNVRAVLKRTHLYEKIGEEHLYGNVANAVMNIHAQTHQVSDEASCPLIEVCFEGDAE
ncbi:STAS domain-containing protein [bacterium]|nr:STAS domain-containing protein [bacterium]